MGDFAPQALQNVKLSELIHRAVDKSYEDLHALTKSLQKEEDEDRRTSILNYIREARQRFIHLLILVKWSSQSSLLSKCNQLLESSQEYTNRLNETNDRLFFMHADLNPVKERLYDITTAVDVLFGGKYLRLPTIIENSMMPRKIAPVDIEKTSTVLNDLLRFRLLEIEIPDELASVRIEDGVVVCTVDGQFEFTLTVQGESADSKWKVVDISTVLSDGIGEKDRLRSMSGSPDNTSAGSIAIRALQQVSPSPVHYYHLQNIVQKRLNNSTEPLREAYGIIRDFCACLALEVLYTQALLLLEGRWKNFLVVKFHREHHALDFLYWEGLVNSHGTYSLAKKAELGAKNVDSWRDLPVPSDAMCLRIAVDGYPNSSTANTTNMASGSFPTSLLAVKIFPSLPPSIAHSSTSQVLRVPSALEELSAERLLLDAMKAHALSSLRSLQQKLTMGIFGHGGTNRVGQSASSTDSEDEDEPPLSVSLVNSSLGSVTLSSPGVGSGSGSGSLVGSCSGSGASFRLDSKQTITKLVTGEPLFIESNGIRLRMKRADIDGLQNQLEISVDLRSGAFIVRSERVHDSTATRPGFVDGSANLRSSRFASEAIRDLQRILNLPLTFQLLASGVSTSSTSPSASSSASSASSSSSSALSSTSASPSNMQSKQTSHENALHSAVATALREIAVEEVSQIGRSCLGVDAERCVPLSWEKLIEYRKSHGNDTTDLTISKGSIFFQLASNNECTYYLVVELEKEAHIEYTGEETESLSETDSNAPEREESAYISVPSFALLQTSRRAPRIAAAAVVQYFNRYAAIKLDELQMFSLAAVTKELENDYSLLRQKLCINGVITQNAAPTSPCSERKRKLSATADATDVVFSNGLSTPKAARVAEGGFKSTKNGASQPSPAAGNILHALLLHAVGICNDRVQLQQFYNDASRLKMKVRYFGEGGNSASASLPSCWKKTGGTAGQVIQFGLPDSIKIDSVKIANLFAHLCPGGGMEVCVKTKDAPFPFVSSIELVDSDLYTNALLHRKHKVLDEHHLLFRYPSFSGFWYGRPGMEIGFEAFVRDMLYSVHPLIHFGRQLLRILKPLKRVGVAMKQMNESGKFYIEHMDPFRICLTCRSRDFRRGVGAGAAAAGSNDDDDGAPQRIHRIFVTIQKQNFVLTCGKETSHPLLNYIQSTLNLHKDPRQMLEALERSTVPLTILASIVESKLLSAKYHRVEENGAAPGTSTGPGSGPPSGGSLGVASKLGKTGKKGGKGMKLGYKGKFGGKGMRLGYTSEKGLSQDEKLFTPSELVLIPRSQYRVKLAYSNRCSVDIWFLQNQTVKVKSAAGGVVVPSCSSESGQKIAHSNFAEKIEALCTEMSSL